jgi:hypothetical protein
MPQPQSQYLSLPATHFGRQFILIRCIRDAVLLVFNAFFRMRESSDST